MARYALLIMPSANRVYANASVALTQAELEVFSRSVLGGRLTDLTASTIGGVPYVTFAADLAGRDTEFLAHLSSIYALFRVEDDLLRPVRLCSPGRFDDDLITIQKYQGKTNEQFTRLLLNVTLLSSAFARDMLDRKFAVIDPLCGRGTALNQALMLGYDAAGVDLDQQDFEAYTAFIQTWLKRKRIKHHADFRGPVRRNRQVIARRLQISLAATREEYQAGATQHLDVVNADTTRALEFFKPAAFDLLVTDAPYGVQHGSRTPGGAASRSPVGLLVSAVPVWAELLRSGGALGIAWNTFVARREEAAGVLAASGLEVLRSGAYLGFQHRVDQAVSRDVLVARKP